MIIQRHIQVKIDNRIASVCYVEKEIRRLIIEANAANLHRR